MEQLKKIQSVEKESAETNKRWRNIDIAVGIIDVFKTSVAWTIDITF